MTNEEIERIVKMDGVRAVGEGVDGLIVFVETEEDEEDFRKQYDGDAKIERIIVSGEVGAL